MKRLWLACLCACSAPATTGSQSFDRAAMLRDVSALALDNYAALTAATAALATSAQSDDVATVQARWSAAYVAFKMTEAHGFGPAADDFLAMAIGKWPTEAAAVLDMDAATVTTEAQAALLGASRKGLAVIEYVLWDPRFDMRRAYASALAAAVHSDATRLEAAWRDGYADAFARGEAPFGSLKESIDVALNHLLAVTESLAGMRFGVPLGNRNGGTPVPEAVESRYSGQSAAHALATLNGIERLYAGADGRLGLGAIVGARDAALHERVLAAIASAKAAVSALPDPLASLLVMRAADVSLAEKRIRDIHDLLGTEVAVAIGVSVTFSDNDGD